KTVNSIVAALPNMPQGEPRIPRNSGSAAREKCRRLHGGRGPILLAALFRVNHFRAFSQHYEVVKAAWLGLLRAPAAPRRRAVLRLAERLHPANRAGSVRASQGAGNNRKPRPGAVAGSALFGEGHHRRKRRPADAGEGHGHAGPVVARRNPEGP